MDCTQYPGCEYVYVHIKTYPIYRSGELPAAASVSQSHSQLHPMRTATETNKIKASPPIADWLGKTAQLGGAQGRRALFASTESGSTLYSELRAGSKSGHGTSILVPALSGQSGPR